MPKFIVRRTTRSDIEVEADDREGAELVAGCADLSEWDTYDSEITDVEQHVPVLSARITYSFSNPLGGRNTLVSIVSGYASNNLTGGDGLLGRVERRVDELFENYEEVEIEDIFLIKDTTLIEV